jgi:TolB-like protein/tetratricopeptide (TPR) repeat protein
MPVIVVLAWYHGDRGHQKPVRTELAIIAVLLLLGGGALWLYQRSTEHAAAPAVTSANPAAAALSTVSKTTPSVAVLPFVNLSADPANEYLADGIAETMITMLAQVPQLVVIGKTSSFSYKGKDIDIRTIGLQLGVGALLEGSVQRAGERLRVAVQLVSTGDGRHLWAETYDRPASDVFAVQDDIARRVTEALAVALAGRSGAGSIGTTNVAAYDAYLRVKQLVARREAKVLEEGVALLEKAVAADPDFARAWVELSRAYELSSRNEGLTTIGRMPSEQAFALSERAARRAVEAEPGFGGAHAALGRALSVQEKSGSADEYQKAIALSPDDPSVIRAYAYYLKSVDRPADALRMFKPLLAVEPRDAQLLVGYAGLLDADGQIAESLDQYRQAIRLEPEGVVQYFRAAATVDDAIGRRDLALRLFRRAATLDPDDPNMLAALDYHYRIWGENALSRGAEKELRRLGAKRELQQVEAQTSYLDARTQEARRIFGQLLADAPRDVWSLQTLARVRGTADDYRAALRRVEQFRSQLDDADKGAALLADAVICLNAWLDDEKVARDEFARVEPIWRSRHAYGFMSASARGDALARSLACVGRNDDALTELETLVDEGLDVGWRDMAVDPAFDSIRIDPRFRAVSDKLKAADTAARARFRARPDLSDADIESLGN